MWFLTRSDTNQAVQRMKMAGGLKFCIQVVEVLYYPSSENKDADQLCGYREADLRLCFRICRTLVFSWRGSNKKNNVYSQFNYMYLQVRFEIGLNCEGVLA